MKEVGGLFVTAVGCLLLLTACGRSGDSKSATVPMVLDHNRMLIEAEFRRADGTRRTARLWVDTGNPDFIMSEAFARDLGIDLSEAQGSAAGGQRRQLEVAPPTDVRIGGMPLNFAGVKSKVLFQPAWLFQTTHGDANLPSTVLKHYQVVFDYPKLRMTLAQPGTLEPRGMRAPASINPATGIVQIDAMVDGDSMSFALDNGASYSFASQDIVLRLAQKHPDWPSTTGAVGCANIWGWWPDEPAWPVVRLPEILWGPVRLADVAIVGLPDFFPGGATVGNWYSQKTARPVAGFLGPNAFKAFRVEIDYGNGAVLFEKGAEFDSRDMDLVGLTLQPQADGGYQVLGVTREDGHPTVEGIEPGDVLLKVGDLEVKGATMGAVVDALRGNPGDPRTLELERGGRRLQVQAKVEHIL
jgi:hypothetical protein